MLTIFVSSLGFGLEQEDLISAFKVAMDCGWARFLLPIPCWWLDDVRNFSIDL